MLLKRRSLETERRWRVGRSGSDRTGQIRRGFDEESAGTPPQGCEVRRRNDAERVDMTQTITNEKDEVLGRYTR
jgi:hypothetical protein